MRQLFFALLLASLLVACKQSEDKKARALLQKIEHLYASGNYQAALDSIRRLRRDFPQAVESRRRALVLWQEASLKAAQQDIARTDSALQAETARYQQAKTLRERNFIGIKKFIAANGRPLEKAPRNSRHGKAATSAQWQDARWKSRSMRSAWRKVREKD